MTDFWSHELLTSVLLFTLTVAGIYPAAAQDATSQDPDKLGSVTGVIVEAGNGGPLPGANVKIKGTTRGTSTDLNGRYRLEGLGPGTYDLVVSFVGFQEKTVTGVRVEAGQATKLDVKLREEAAQLDEVVVESEAARDSRAGLLKKREAAPVVSNAVSSEMMSKTGASTAADAMKKVTGASVVEDKYVFIRGLGGRYTNTQLNGIDLPTASTERNAVQFDLFSTELLNNITTEKTYTPSQPGNFAGGLINIATESYPSDLKVSVSSSVGVETETHFTSGFISDHRGQWDFLALESGLRDLPDIIQGLSSEKIPTTFKNRVRNAFKEDADGDAARRLGNRLNQVSKSFNDNMAPVQGSAPVNQSYSFGVGNETEFLGNPLGFLLNLDYGYSSSYTKSSIGRWRGPVGASVSDSLQADLLADQRKGSITAEMGGLLTTSYTLSDDHEIGATGIYSRRGESVAQTRSGRWLEQYSGNPDALFQSRRLSYTRRQLYSLQLRGSHFLDGLGDARIEWNTAYSDTRQEEPDTRIFGNMLFTPTRSGEVDSTYQVDVTNFPNPKRIWRDLNEDSYSAKLDVSVPLGSRGELRVGGAYRTDQRSFNERSFEIKPASSEAIPFTGNVESFFSDEHMGIIDTTVIAEDTPFETKNLKFGNTVVENTKPRDRYEGDRTVSAGYAMLDYEVTDRLRLVGGARVERTDVQIQSEAIELQQQGISVLGSDTTGTPGSIEVTDILPSLNAIYNLGDEMNLRVAGSRTLARPTFREIAPFSRVKTVLGERIRGNPNLNRTLITNADLRWEWFPGAGELVAVSVFGKDFQDAIEIQLIPSTNDQRSWTDTDARLYGAEFEIRADLRRIAPALENFSIGTNLALIESEVQVDSTSSGTGSRPMQGQSPYTFNLNLSYDNRQTGTSAGLYFNTAGERLQALGVFAQRDVYEKPFTSLNFNFSQRFRDHWSLSVSVENVLASEREETLPFKGREFTYSDPVGQREISVGISYEL